MCTNSQFRTKLNQQIATAAENNHLSTILKMIHNPINRNYFETVTPQHQPLCWILKHAIIPEETAFFELQAKISVLCQICQDIITHCPSAANISNKYGELPLHFSCKRNWYGVSELLLRYHPEGATYKTVSKAIADLNTNEDGEIIFTSLPLRSVWDEKPYDMLPIHLLVKEKSSMFNHNENNGSGMNTEQQEMEMIIKHIRLLAKAYPQGLLEQTSEGQTPLHISATFGQAQTFMELFRLCPKAASIRDIQGDLPIDIILHPYDIPYDRFGAHLSVILGELIRIDIENSIPSIEGWLENYYIIGLCPDEDEANGFSSSRRSHFLPMKGVLAIQEMMSTLIHSVYEFKTTGMVHSYDKRKWCCPGYFKNLLHRALTIGVDGDVIDTYIIMQERFQKHFSSFPSIHRDEDDVVTYHQYKDLNYPFKLQIENRDDQDNLPIHIAARSTPDMIEFLIKAFPGGVRQRDRDGKLALHLALQHHCKLEAIQALFDAYPPAILLPDLSEDQYKGLLPWQIAAVCKADVNILYFLIKNCPHTLPSFNGSMDD